MTNTRSILVYSVLPIAVISIGVGITNHLFADLKPSTAIVSPQQLPAFLDRLQILWGHYLDMIQILISLLTGVVAVSAGIVRFGGKEPVADRGYYAGGMVSLLIALTFAILWRVDAELLMEMEIFGNRDVALAFFQANGVGNPFTTSFRYLPLIGIYGDCAKIFMFGTAYGFIAGLAFLARFAFSNMPEATRARSRLQKTVDVSD